MDSAKFDSHQLTDMKKACQHHCFSTLNHNLGYCYNDARVIKWLWKQTVTNKFRGGRGASKTKRQVCKVSTGVCSCSVGRVLRPGFSFPTSLCTLRGCCLAAWFPSGS